MKRRTKIVVILLGVLLVVGFVVVRCSGGDQPSSSNGTTPTDTPTVSESTAPSPTSNPSPSPAKGSRVVVAAAANSVTLLPTAALLPYDQQQQLARRYVALEQRGAFLSATRESVQWLLALTGYSSVAEASLNAAYSVQALKYRVDDVQPSKAVVSMYVITSWVTADKLLYRTPAILQVSLVKQGKHWLYVSSVTASGNDAPQPQPNLSFEETVARFQPFLKEYADYA